MGVVFQRTGLLNITTQHPGAALFHSYKEVVVLTYTNNSSIPGLDGFKTDVLYRNP
ncbi:hypothetical protein [Brevinema andersonii]|uniref:hypothetical protein n=1 Tax=Brevinema andersonii TaxID=34097 RepID=UPI0013564AD1|nr:hypothetical protein [Brevinema andersonii]